MSLDFVVVTDLHINGYGFLSEFIEDTDAPIYKAVSNVVKYAKENGIEHMAILGDIFDKPYPSQEDQKRLLRFLKSTDLNIYMIFGNHDYASDSQHSLVMSEFFAEELSSKIHVYTKPTLIKIKDVPFSMLPWPYKKSLTKGPCINCAHITVKGSKTDGGKVMTKGDELKVRNNQHWIIGDLHTRQKYYPGTLVQKSFGEGLPKGFLHVSARVKDDKLRIKEDWIIVKPVYALVNLRIDELGDLEKIKPLNHKELKIYTLKVKQGVVLPPNIRQKHLNIHNIKYDSKDKVIEDKTGRKITLDGVSDPFENLASFMKKEGLSDREIKQGLKYANKLLEKRTT